MIKFILDAMYYQQVLFLMFATSSLIIFKVPVNLIIKILIVLVICYIIKFGKVKVPDDAECIATIIQSNKSNKYYLSYEFYKINGKCVYKKMEEYDVGITTQVVHPKLIDTKYIRNKKSFEKLKLLFPFFLLSAV